MTALTWSAHHAFTQLPHQPSSAQGTKNPKKNKAVLPSLVGTHRENLGEGHRIQTGYRPRRLQPVHWPQGSRTSDAVAMKVKVKVT